MYMLLMSMTFMAIIFIFMKHPLSMGMILLIQTISISLITGMMNHNFWYSYILFIIMIGGMLVLFLYMTSIASNEKFKFSSNLLIISLIMYTSMLYTPEMFKFYLNFSNLKENMYPNMTMSLNKYFNYPNNLIMMIMFFYLFITMVMVTKITKNEIGPLRQKK
uniref:NADH dehydrogenase subunit 6 n=1 Tax=Lema decempunctata TaxID=1412118 RepID=UPI0022A701DB|nr:NADH dehydrogenase subunit 6 [Lema decempunctata]UZS91167.1 NADH dehydrogenase subunit 6 [Lema decempunctata]